MDKTTIELLTKEHMDELFQFELEYRADSIDFGTPIFTDNYDRVSFDETTERLIEDQERGILFTYLIKNIHNKIIGLVFLSNIVWGGRRKAEIGCRIAKRYQMKGYVSIGKQILKEAKLVHGFHRIEAITTRDNIPAQLLAIKYGFQYVGISHKYFLAGDGWKDAIIFELLLDNDEYSREI